MNFNQFFFIWLFYLNYQIMECKTESITYFSAERPVVDWFDKTMFKKFTVRSKRLSRRDPKHYVEIYVHSLIIITNALKVDLYFYQLLTNGYRPSFIELHFKFCDMLDSDKWFGEGVKKALGGRQCPFPPGEYYMKNMSIPFIPKGFPFTKGRIYCNVSYTLDGVTKPIGAGNIDIEVKVDKIKNKN